MKEVNRNELISRMTAFAERVIDELLKEFPESYQDRSGVVSFIVSGLIDREIELNYVDALRETQKTTDLISLKQ